MPMNLKATSPLQYIYLLPAESIPITLLKNKNSNTGHLVRILFVLSLIIFTTQSFGQKKEFKNNAVYAEIFGNAQTILSLNYEKQINIKKIEWLRFGLRLGIGVGKNKFDHKLIYNLPIEFNTVIGKRNNNFEIGLGCTQIIGTSNLKDTIIPEQFKRNNDYALLLRLGYKYVSDNNFIFRIAPLAILAHDPPKDNSLKLYYSLGISFGYCFNFHKN